MGSLYSSSASIRTLGFRTAEIMASRGAREGNNALLKVRGALHPIDQTPSIQDPASVISRYDIKELLSYAIKNNCSYEAYDLLCENLRVMKMLSSINIHALRFSNA